MLLLLLDDFLSRSQLGWRLSFALFGRARGLFDWGLGKVRQSPEQQGQGKDNVIGGAV
jgi:hypothetical protein